MELRRRCADLRLADFPVRRDVQGRWRDVDARNHVNNVVVVDLFSDSRNHVMADLFGRVGRPEGMFFVVGQQATFYAGEARFPGQLAIGSGVIEIGAKTVRFGQAFFHEGRCTALAEALLVCTCKGRAAALPAELATALHELLLPAGMLPRQLIEL